MSNLYRGPSIDASYQVSVHLAKPVVAMSVNGLGQNEQLYKGPSIDASYQVLIHLAGRFQRRICFRNQPIRKRMACGGHVC
jgi:hypothetical protein